MNVYGIRLRKDGKGVLAALRPNFDEPLVYEGGRRYRLCPLSSTGQRWPYPVYDSGGVRQLEDTIGAVKVR
jgi:hypothetical protein